MEKSRKIIFVSHCILNQNVNPSNREFAPGVVRDIVNLISESGIGLVQMPCPEVEFDGGLDRKPKSKDSYDTSPYRTYCNKLAKLVLKEIQKYKEKKYNVLCILGVEFSPTCAVFQLENGNKNTPGKGILMEEFEKEMKRKNFQVPIIGANLRNPKSTLEKLQSLLKYA